MMTLRRRLVRAWVVKHWAVVVFLLALALRLGYAFLAEQVDPFLRADALYGDAGEYDWIASNVEQGLGFASHGGTRRSFRPPLYPLFLAAIYRVFGRNLLTVRLVQAMVGAFTCVMSARIGDRLLGDKVVILSGIGTALHPLLVYFGAWIITDTLFCSAILWLPIISFTLAGLIFYGGTRYALPMAPLVTILAAAGAASVVWRATRTRYSLSAEQMRSPR